MPDRRRFFSLSLDLLCVAGVDGYFKLLNPSFERTLGFSIQQLLAEPFINFVHPDDRTATLAETEKLSQGYQTIGFENRYRCKDGSYRWLLWSATSYAESGMLYAIARDITSQKQIEKRLNNKVQQQAALAELSLSSLSQNLEEFMQQATALVAKTLEVDTCKILELVRERQILRLKAGVGWHYPQGGNTPPEVGLDSHAGYALQTPEPVIANTVIAKEVIAKEVIAKDLCLETRDRATLESDPAVSSISVQILGKRSPFGVLEVHTTYPRSFNQNDVSFLQSVANILSSSIARQQSEDKIREQASLLDISTDAIVVYSLDQKIMYWNQGAEQLYGWTAAEAMDQNANSLLHGAPPEKLAVIHEMILQQGEWRGELTQITKSEQTILVESHWNLVRDRHHQPQSILVVNTDITEKKQLEAQFLRAQRLESIGTLAGGIAHDLNNILTPILGVAQLLSKHLPDSSAQTQRLIEILVQSARRGSSLVNQVLSFSRGMEGDRIEIQLRHLVSEIRHIAAETFPKSIEFEIEIPKDSWAICGDVTQIHQVLMNLCVNARDAMPSGGVLNISAHNLNIDESYARMNLEAKIGPYVVTTISDTGAGISPDNLEKIFDPFFTTKAPGHGTGLGLSTVLTIVKSHGGFLKVYSELGQGTRVNVYWPAIVACEVPAQPETVVPVGDGELILVVDDEAPIREVTQMSLETHNYRVLAAKDGIDAIALYAKHKDEIALVLMDMMMPVMDGKVAAQTLHRINPELGIIMTSGLASNQSEAEALGDSVKAFLIKPFTSEKLLQTIDQLIG